MIPGLSHQEYAAFDFFRTRTATKLPGIFSSDFWETLVFQLSLREPAVLHAVIALAATHRRAIALGHTQRPALSRDLELNDSNERLALQQFNKAVTHLRHLEKRDRQSLRITLVSCMIFICIELLKGEVGASQAHFQSGLKLLREIQPNGAEASAMVQPLPDSTDDHLAEAFIRLNIQSSIVGEGPDHNYTAGLSTRCGSEPQIPLIFDSLSSARRHLDHIFQEIHGLSAEAKQLTLERAGIPSQLTLQRERLQLSLKLWLRTFSSSIPRIDALQTERSDRIALGVPLLRLHHAMGSVNVATCLRYGDEMAFDSYTTDFSSILEQAIDLWNKISYLLPVPPLLPPSDHLSFTVDMGFIPPLYFTALKCRVPQFRRLAINFLASAPHREGIWDGPVAAAIACRVMEIEEGNFYSDAGIEFSRVSPLSGTNPPSLHSDDSPLVPDANRVNYVNVTLPEPGTGERVILICKRYRHGKNEQKGVWEEERFEVDGTKSRPGEQETHNLSCAW